MVVVEARQLLDDGMSHIQVGSDRSTLLTNKRDVDFRHLFGGDLRMIFPPNKTDSIFNI